jgi:hypothetical protein
VKRLLVLGFLGLMGWVVLTRYQAHTHAVPRPQIRTPQSLLRDAPSGAAESTPEYACDGRTRCAEMRSCEEAKYFLQHCPGVKIDGDGDGIPCERQFCGGG